MSSRARQRLDASSYLREFGLRNATVLVDYSGRTTEWRVPSLSVGLMHARTRSVISGRATVAAAGGKPWQLTFETDESESDRTLTLKTSVTDLVPRSIAGTIPQLSLLQALDLPVDGNAAMQLTSDGEVRTATVNLARRARQLAPAGVARGAARGRGGIDQCRLRRRRREGYAGAVDAELARTAASRMSGGAQQRAGRRRRASRHGRISCAPAKASFAAEEFNVPAIALDELYANGRILPHRGEVELADFKLRAGGAEIALSRATSLPACSPPARGSKAR